MGLSNKIARLGIFIFIALSLSGCEWLGFRSWTWNQKLTVTVDTPNGPVSGSSVTEVGVTIPPEWWGVGDFKGASSSYVSGEGVVVEVSEGKYLFALLYGHDTAYRAFALPATKTKTTGNVFQEYDRLERLRATRSLKPEWYPMLLASTNDIDRGDFEEVGPANFSTVFGPGYRLRSIDISITDEDVTHGVLVKYLGWWENYKDANGNKKIPRYRNVSPRGWDSLGELHFWSRKNIPW